MQETLQDTAPQFGATTSGAKSTRRSRRTPASAPTAQNGRSERPAAAECKSLPAAENAQVGIAPAVVRAAGRIDRLAALRPGVPPQAKGAVLVNGPMTELGGGAVSRSGALS